MNYNHKLTFPLSLLACFLWGSAFPTLKTLYSLLAIGNGFGEKIYLAGIRFTLAGIVILIFYSVRFKKLPLLKDRKEYGQAILLGIFQTGIMYAFFYIGVYNTTGIKSAILSQGGIFIVVFTAHFVYPDDRLNIAKIAGTCLGLMGIVAVNIQQLGSGHISSFTFTGEGFLLISGFFSAVGTFMAKKLGRSIAPVLLTGWQMFSGGLLLLIIGVLCYPHYLSIKSSISVLLLLYSIIISSGAFTLWYILLQHNKAAKLSVIKFSIPVFGAMSSAVLLPNETMSLNMILGLIFVAVGIYICNRPGEQAA